MSHPISPEAQRLADRLRKTAEEIESAARYGVPTPNVVSVDHFGSGQVGFSADEILFAAWVDYTEADVEHYDYLGSSWSRAEVDCNGLSLRFSVHHRDAEVTA